ncbi:DUF4145 domain-containing protein [Enterococcus hirae]|nr:DUF4145 domain-containing protein [Enterococcus hirae]
MFKEVSVKYRDRQNIETIYLPNNCPHCGNTMTPYVYFGASSYNLIDNNRIFGILAQCVIDECHKFYSLQFKNMFNEDEGYFENILIKDNYRPPIKVDLPENIEKVSPTFVSIYTQATKAASEKLDQIAGVGYRKSLEFLIKDYAILNNPEDKEKIEKMPLGTVIEKYLTDFPKLQKLAKAATWLGNDETHYVRKHTNKDIRDMIAFIKSASQFIAADYDADIADQFIHGN